MGLVHGALRPCNVMVLEDGRVKLMDLELAGLRDARPTDGSLVAKPSAEYISPEQICRAPVTEKTDIYSFAVILYEMLCGVPPFQAETRDAVLEKHLTEPPPPMRPRRAVPASVESIVTQALDKQPGLRPLMQDVLNRLWSDAHRPTNRRIRTVAIVGGAAAAAPPPRGAARRRARRRRPRRRRGRRRRGRPRGRPPARGRPRQPPRGRGGGGQGRPRRRGPRRGRGEPSPP